MDATKLCRLLMIVFLLSRVELKCGLLITSEDYFCYKFAFSCLFGIHLLEIRVNNMRKEPVFPIKQFTHQKRVYF